MYPSQVIWNPKTIPSVRFFSPIRIFPSTESQSSTIPLLRPDGEWSPDRIGEDTCRRDRRIANRSERGMRSCQSWSIILRWWHFMPFLSISLEGVNPNFASSCNMPHFSISFPEKWYSIFDLISNRWAPTIQLYKLDETNPWSIWPTFPKVGLTVLPRHFADAFLGAFFSSDGHAPGTLASGMREKDLERRKNSVPNGNRARWRRILGRCFPPTEDEVGQLKGVKLKRHS